MNNNDLLLLSGNDIPFVKAQIVIHQPTIKEIAFIGEESFFIGCELINFSKNNLLEKDRMNLEDKSNFDILIAILREQNAVMRRNKDCVEMVLALLFPDYMIKLNDKNIELKKEDEVESHFINDENFEDFKKIFNQMFAFKKDEIQDYNPSGDLASQIAEKLRARHQKLAEAKHENQKIDILSRYISILAVGECKDINSLFQYTVYQLFDEFERYQLKISYDMNIQARMAGAKDLEEVENWMKDIHS